MREHILGRRSDWTGRTVIVSSNDLPVGTSLNLPIVPYDSPNLGVSILYPTQESNLDTKTLEALASTDPIPTRQPKPKYDEKDVDIVMQQTNRSKEDAIDALEKRDGDVVEAIIFLLVN